MRGQGWRGDIALGRADDDPLMAVSASHRLQRTSRSDWRTWSILPPRRRSPTHN